MLQVEITYIRDGKIWKPSKLALAAMDAGGEYLANRHKPKPYKRLVRLEFLYGVFRWLSYLADKADINDEDVLLDSRLILMPLGLLYPRFALQYRQSLASMNYDIITVEARPAEDEAVLNAELREIWSKRKRVVLSSFHRILMNAEHKVMRQSYATMPVIDETGYVEHVVDIKWVRQQIQKLLGSQGIIIGIHAIKTELAVISYAYQQSEAMGYSVKFEQVTALQKSLRKVA